MLNNKIIRKAEYRYTTRFLDFPVSVTDDMLNLVIDSRYTTSIFSQLKLNRFKLSSLDLVISSMGYFSFQLPFRIYFAN